MGYVKKSIQRINRILDNRELPQNWNEFIDDCSKGENILIKRKNKHLYCTNCKNEYKHTSKLKPILKCPKCHEILAIKHWNTKSVTYRKSLILVDKVEDEYIFRLFELKSEYKYEVWERDCVEYARCFLNEKVTVIRQNVCRNMGSLSVNHNINAKYSKLKWRKFDSYWRSISTKGQVYHYNLKDLFKDTEYQYSQIWELAKHKDYIDIENSMINSKYHKSFELLVKAKLYNLASEGDLYSFDKKGSFEERFKVSKELYPFMKKYDITNKELDRLKILKQPNIQKVRYLTNYSFDYLEDITKYININKFIDYSKRIKNFDIHTYVDYLRFCEKLGFNMKDKKILYPRTGRELNKKHDELEKQYEIKKDELINNSIKKRYEELKAFTFEDNQFIIAPANTIDSLIDESKQQNNCVRTYSEKYANGKCDIYFMRSIKKPNKSLVTVEVKNNVVVQQRTKNNNDTTNNQKAFLEKWQIKVLDRVNSII